MARPSGVITRTVTFGVGYETASGETLGMRVTFEPTRTLLWLANGSPAIAAAYTSTAADGLEGSVQLPITNQSGYGDGAGNAIVPGANGHVFLYKVKAIYTRAGQTVYTGPDLFVTIPAGDGPIDLDNLIPVTSPGGTTVSVPDIWSQQVAAAKAIADRFVILDPAQSAQYPIGTPPPGTPAGSLIVRTTV